MSKVKLFIHMADLIQRCVQYESLIEEQLTHI